MEVDVEFAHDLADLGVDVRGGGGPGRERLVVAVGGADEPGLAHLRAGVLRQTNRTVAMRSGPLGRLVGRGGGCPHGRKDCIDKHHLHRYFCIDEC